MPFNVRSAFPYCHPPFKVISPENSCRSNYEQFFPVHHHLGFTTRSHAHKTHYQHPSASSSPFEVTLHHRSHSAHGLSLALADPTQLAEILARWVADAHLRTCLYSTEHIADVMRKQSLDISKVTYYKNMVRVLGG